MARPTKLSGVRQKAILAGIRLGLKLEEATANAGIDYSTMRRWIQRGEKEQSGIYFEFCEALKKAEAEAEQLLLKRIQEASAGGKKFVETQEIYEGRGKRRFLVRRVTTTKTTVPEWQAAAWILERRFPERYGRRVRIAVDWREEARKLGYDPDKLLSGVVEGLVAAGEGSVVNGGPAPSEAVHGND